MSTVEPQDVVATVTRWKPGMYHWSDPLISGIRERMQKAFPRGKGTRWVKRKAIYVDTAGNYGDVRGEAKYKWFYPITTTDSVYYGEEGREIVPHSLVCLASANFHLDKARAEVIKHAPEDIRILLEEVDRLRELLAK